MTLVLRVAAPSPSAVLKPLPASKGLLHLPMLFRVPFTPEVSQEMMLSSDTAYTNVHRKIKYFLGKVFKMPGFRTEGEKKVLNVDAAFVAYPHPKTPGCSLTWSGDEEEFCLDPGHSDYIERLVPLTVRGKNGKTHKVIGSKEPTVGLDIQVIGSVSGIPTNGTVSEG